MAKAKHCFIADSTPELDERVRQWAEEQGDLVSCAIAWKGHTMVWLHIDVDVVAFRLTFPEMEYNR